MAKAGRSGSVVFCPSCSRPMRGAEHEGDEVCARCFEAYAAPVRKYDPGEGDDWRSEDYDGSQDRLYDPFDVWMTSPAQRVRDLARAAYYRANYGLGNEPVNELVLARLFLKMEERHQWRQERLARRERHAARIAPNPPAYIARISPTAGRGEGRRKAIACEMMFG